jgi:hypothetical protein
LEKKLYPVSSSIFLTLYKPNPCPLNTKLEAVCKLL